MPSKVSKNIFNIRDNLFFTQTNGLLFYDPAAYIFVRIFNETFANFGKKLFSTNIMQIRHLQIKR